MATSTIDIAGLDGGRVNLTSAQLHELDARVEGRVLRPGRRGLGRCRAGLERDGRQDPALVVQPTSARDVAAAVGFAREHGLLLSVKGGGHNIAGTSIAEGGLTLDMSRMREVTVDPDAGSRTSGPGACSVTSTGQRKRTVWRPCSDSCPRPASPA